LFILCESPKTTEPITDVELGLLKYFLEMNIDNGSTSFRNQALSLLKKVSGRTAGRSPIHLCHSSFAAFHSTERELAVRRQTNAEEASDGRRHAHRTLSGVCDDICSRDVDTRPLFRRRTI
jgi:hypothetical protein